MAQTGVKLKIFIPCLEVRAKVGLVKDENAFHHMNVMVSQLSPHKKIDKVIIKLFPESGKLFDTTKKP